MRIKASTDYGMRAVLYLAERGVVCSSKEISEQMSIPRDYLIQLALRLRKSGVLKAHPGKNGGYELARPISQISVGDIVSAFDADPKLARPDYTEAESACARSAFRLCDLAESCVSSAMNSISISDLIEAEDASNPKRQVIDAALRKDRSDARG